MRIAFVGAGGVGGYFGGRLAAAGVDTTFVVRGRTLEALRRRGLKIESIGGDFAIESVKATNDPSAIGPVDAVFFAVKTWQLPEAALAARPLIGQETLVVPLENGLDAPNELAAALGLQHVLGGLCGIVSYVVEPGHVRHTGAEPIIMFGELDHSLSDRAIRLRNVLRSSGVQCEVSLDILRSMWTKFLFITPMSAIGAITRVPVGVWRRTPETRSLALAALAEIYSVAKARGILLEDNAIEVTMGRYDALPPQSTSSLQRDMLEGRPSEMDAQVGTLLRLAKASSVDVPVNEFFYGMMLPQEQMARSRTD